MTFRSRPEYRKVAFLLASLLCVVPVLSTPTTDSLMVNTEDCRAQGFDPMRLACSTCALLPKQHQKTCKSCCQSYMDLARLRSKPYEAAVLVHAAGGRGGAQLDELLKDTETWESLLKEKGGKERLQVLNKKSPGYGRNRMSYDMMEMLLSGLSSEVLLLDEKLPTRGDLDYDKLSTKAQEVISLQGLSKDDIQDLLTTLL